MRRVLSHCSGSSSNAGGVWSTFISPLSFKCARRYVALRVGGRKTPLGFSSPLGKYPQVKQGRPQGVVRRIPGTTKVEYTNKKGRAFRFSIPVTELTHPPVNAPSFRGGRWKHLDTSYCDTGELEFEMPSPVEEYLRQRISREDIGGGNTALSSSSDVILSLTVEELQELGKRFATFCKEYVLMDTSGMKNSMTYSELNTGPDYEHFDRKLMRRRYWLAIRRNYEMVKELLWPSDVLDKEERDFSPHGAAESTGGPLEVMEVDGKLSPLLSAEEMLDVLTWVHAASTFCVRAWHSYDLVDQSAFQPLDLSREVRVLAQLVKDMNALTFFQNCKSARSHASDRLTTCIGLCHAHSVPFSVFFHSSTSVSEASFLLSHLLTHLPDDMSAAEAIRLIHAVERVTESESSKDIFYAFSSAETGEVQHSERFLGFVKLCGSCASDGIEAIRNVDEEELSVLLRFMVHLKECNRSFFQLPSTLNNDGPRSTTVTVMEQRRMILRFEEVCLARCRYLLYQLDRDGTVAMNGEEDVSTTMPIVALQQHRESMEGTPQTFLHYRVGLRHAQGLRRVSIRNQSSHLLLWIERLNRANDHPTSSVTELAVDIMNHMAKLSANGTKKLTLVDVIRILPILAEVLRGSPNRAAVESRYERLLLHIGTTIGVELQKHPSMDSLIAVLDGLAKCKVLPSSFPQLEMVVARYCIEGEGITVGQVNEVLVSMLKLRGPGQVSPALLHSAASVAQKCITSLSDSFPLEQTTTRIDTASPSTGVHPLLEMLNSLRYARYAALPGLIAQLSERANMINMEWNPPSRCVFGILLAYLGATLEDGEASLSAATLDKARVELRASESALPLLDASLRADTLLSYAALGLALSEENTTYVHQCTDLHTFMSPQHAVNMLDGLEILGCHQTELYIRYVQWFVDRLNDHSQGRMDSEVLRAVMNVFHLRHLPQNVKVRAVTALEEELRRMEQQRQHWHDEHGMGMPGANNSFEESYLSKKSAVGEMEATMMEICAIIHRAQTEEVHC